MLWRATCSSILSSTFCSSRPRVSSTSSEMSFRMPLRTRNIDSAQRKKVGLCRLHSYLLTGTASAPSPPRPTVLICPRISRRSNSPSRLRLPRNRGPSLAVNMDGSAPRCFCGVVQTCKGLHFSGYVTNVIPINQ